MWNRSSQDLPEGDDGGRPFLVIDEGQDMPPQFYHALVALGFDRFFVVADQNQQITEKNRQSEGNRGLSSHRYGRGDRTQAELSQSSSRGEVGRRVLHRRSGEPAPGDPAG